jgi:succinate dehydrogenase / fumarate reductase cytochrome b subunit
MQPAAVPKISSTFIWRRVHSLMGFWLVIYLFEHLLVNSQAALWISEDGSNFVRLVNSLESLPYIRIVETVFIAIPLGIHLVWGVKRALTAKLNVAGSSGTKPELKYSRNVAFSLQRLTSWVLLFGIIGHVAQMRFIDQPKRIAIGGKEQSMVKITNDEGLAPLAQKVGATLFYPTEMNGLKPNQVFATSDTPGTAMLLMVRDTFKSPVMAILYTIFLLAAAFHAFNGFWTFLIAWGLILSYRSQKAMIPVCLIGMGILAFFGLAAIWGSYWLGGQ